ncbi:pyridoxal phosphate-dependent aminotransferase [Anaerorhabdus sp.]|uniref:pyridoxal phosphate-dependent aminotransferase n=2 Tax=Anaerorhabdus sp. TaxID=1872524 RepID=UPI002B1FB7DA|nr:aminotransferase class I/II-fold pyridoxal phosphate-dependent enzyme [Anaerorhabdus sp.]MEA4875686.1 aminotransferase class I/II-fold pyridoxal phosphate-dependent enzyme [Anaerorhabdus sp.]
MSGKKYLNEIIQQIPPSGIRKYFDLASQMEGVVSLGVGEPDFETPWHIREEAIYAIKSGKTFYTSNVGLPQLRKEICNYYRRRFNVSYKWDKECMVTVGGSEAIDIVMRTILNPGDEVILLQPGYVAYEPLVRLAGGVPVIIELKEENKFKLTAEELQSAISDKTKMLFINFPGNPTGGSMSREDYEKIVPIIKQHDFVVLTDEIYAELSYGNEFCTIASFEEIKEQVIIINGFSKAYSMTGWRVGYLLADEEIIKSMNKIHQYCIMCPSTISQYAAVEAAAHGDADCKLHHDSFEGRRNFIVNGLNRIGLKCHMPEGAFYVFPSIKSTGLTSDEFCEQLLNTEKVAVVPGTAFGGCGEGYIRISYAYSIDEIKEALTRIERFLNSLKK